MKYKLNKATFIDYMFSDKDDYLYWGKRVAEELSCDGEITITLQEMLDGTGDIPLWYFHLEDEKGHPKYIDPQNEELID